MSHHGDQPLTPEQQAILAQLQGEVQGTFPEGRMHPADEGALMLTIGHADGKVVIQFPQPVLWVGFNAEQAVAIAQLLVQHAQAVSGGVIELRV